ncbi:MAG: thioesterase domain-containing protein, partial [Bdellovibrionota bacterium]
DEILGVLSPQIQQSADFTVAGLPDERLDSIPVLFFRPKSGQISLTSKFKQQISNDLQTLPSLQRPRKIIPFPPKHRLSGIKPAQEELRDWITDYERIRFEDWGNPSGKKILALHGFMGSPHDFYNLALQLPEFHWVVPYLPGHGTPIGQFDNFEHGCELLVKWYQDFFPHTSFSLMGYSMGGRIALGILERILKDEGIKLLDDLILLSTSLGLDDEEKCRTRRTQDQDASLQLHFSTEEEKRQFLQTWYSSSMWGTLNTKEFFSSLVEKRLGTPHDEWSKSMQLFGQGTHPNFKQTLKKLALYHHQTTGRRCYCFGALDSKYKKFAEEYKTLGFTTKEF